MRSAYVPRTENCGTCLHWSTDANFEHTGKCKLTGKVTDMGNHCDVQFDSLVR